MAYSTSSARREVYQKIFDENAFPYGEFLVIPRDTLMRFIKATPADLAPDVNRAYNDILKDVISLYQSTGGREDLSLSIPAGPRYTKFVYVVDPHGIYIPYHYHIPELYGVYFRKKAIREDSLEFLKLAYRLLTDNHFYERLRISSFDKHDIQAILKHPTLSIGILLALYFEALYNHAMAHHVLEDVSTWYEINNIDKYSAIHDAKKEEAFCEYIMYRATRGEAGWNEAKGGYALKLLYDLRDVFSIPPISPEYMMRFIKAFRSVFPAILYIHRHKTIYRKHPFYIPAIEREISTKLSFVFNGLWLDHMYSVEPMRVRIEGKEIFDRMFLINI